MSSEPALRRWLPGFGIWLSLALLITVATGFVSTFIAFTWGIGGHASPSEAIPTALLMSSLLAALFWFSYLGTLLFGGVIAGARQVQPVLVVLWVAAIGTVWWIWLAFVPK